MKFKNSFILLFFLVYLFQMYSCAKNSNELATETLIKIREEKLVKEVNKIESFLKSIEEEENKIKSFIGSEKINHNISNLPTFRQKNRKMTAEEKEQETIKRLEKRLKSDEDIDDMYSDKSDKNKATDNNMGDKLNRLEKSAKSVKEAKSVKQNRKVEESSKVEESTKVADKVESNSSLKLFSQNTKLYQLQGNKLRINTQLLTLDEKKVLTDLLDLFEKNNRNKHSISNSLLQTFENDIGKQEKIEEIKESKDKKESKERKESKDKKESTEIKESKAKKESKENASIKNEDGSTTISTNSTPSPKQSISVMKKSAKTKHTIQYEPVITHIPKNNDNYNNKDQLGLKNPNEDKPNNESFNNNDIDAYYISNFDKKKNKDVIVKEQNKVKAEAMAEAKIEEKINEIKAINKIKISPKNINNPDESKVLGGRVYEPPQIRKGNNLRTVVSNKNELANKYEEAEVIDSTSSSPYINSNRSRNSSNSNTISNTIKRSFDRGDHDYLRNSEGTYTEAAEADKDFQNKKYETPVINYNNYVNSMNNGSNSNSDYLNRKFTTMNPTFGIGMNRNEYYNYNFKQKDKNLHNVNNNIPVSSVSPVIYSEGSGQQEGFNDYGAILEDYYNQ